MNGNLVPVATNQNGVPILFQDRTNGMFYLQTQYGLVPSDSNGNPLQQQQQRTFDFNQQQQQYGYQQQTQTIPNVGGSRYGGRYQQQNQQQTLGLGGIPNNTLPNSNTNNVTSKYGNKYGTAQQQPQVQQQPVSNKNTQVNVSTSIFIPAGYKAQPGSEFIPLYDETTEDIDVVVDDNTKTYKFIIVKK